MDHVLLASGESAPQREARIRELFGFFDEQGRGYLDHALIERGLAALGMPSESDYARDLLGAWDADKDGRVEYGEFKRYMEEKEVELYRIFQAIDVEHSGCISPEELWHALVRAGEQYTPNARTCLVCRFASSNCVLVLVVLGISIYWLGLLVY